MGIMVVTVYLLHWKYSKNDAIFCGMQGSVLATVEAWPQLQFLY
jgi:hypothetical protein